MNQCRGPGLGDAEAGSLGGGGGCGKGDGVAAKGGTVARSSGVGVIPVADAAKAMLDGGGVPPV